MWKDPEIKVSAVWLFIQTVRLWNKKWLLYVCFFIVFQGNVTFSCSEPQIVPITFVNPRSSYLLLPGTPQIDGLSVSFQFRTWNRDGLLLSTELSEGSGTLMLMLEGGTLRLLIKKEAGHGTEILTGTVIADFHLIPPPSFPFLICLTFFLFSSFSPTLPFLSCFTFHLSSSLFFTL